VIQKLTPILFVCIYHIAGQCLHESGSQNYLCGDGQEDHTVKFGVLKGQYQLVSPESLLRNLQWREMLRSPTYQSHLVGIAVVVSISPHKPNILYRVRTKSSMEVTFSPVSKDRKNFDAQNDHLLSKI